MIEYPGKELLFIRWIDSLSLHQWIHIDTFKTDMPNDSLECESIGWLVYEDKESIAIAPHRSATKNIDGIIRIPKVSIIKMWEITL